MSDELFAVGVDYVLEILRDSSPTSDSCISVELKSGRRTIITHYTFDRSSDRRALVDDVVRELRRQEAFYREGT